MAITNDEKQSIINAVLSSIRTNSRTIDQLTIVTEVADTDNFEIHGGKRVAFSKLRELILSKSGVNDKLPELDDVVEFKEVRNDITLIVTQQTSVLGGIAGSTDAGYGAVYDPTRKRFFLMYYGEEAQTDASVVTAYGNFADEDRFGASPSSGGAASLSQASSISARMTAACTIGTGPTSLLWRQRSTPSRYSRQ